MTQVILREEVKTPGLYLVLKLYLGTYFLILFITYTIGYMCGWICANIHWLDSVVYIRNLNYVAYDSHPKQPTNRPF